MEAFLLSGGETEFEGGTIIAVLWNSGGAAVPRDQFILFKCGRTKFSRIVQTFHRFGLAAVSGQGGDGGVVLSDSCQPLLQQLVPLLLPQSLQVFCSLQRRLSESRKTFTSAVDQLSTGNRLLFLSSTGRRLDASPRVAFAGY